MNNLSASCDNSTRHTLGKEFLVLLSCHTQIDIADIILVGKPME